MLHTKQLSSNRGFTIVELLIVIVVIGILAGISIVAYSGVQQRATNAKTINDIASVKKLIEAYAVENGFYPVTSTTPLSGSSSSSITLTDSGCPDGTSQIDWVPDLDTTLPQSTHNTGKGIGGLGGCYMYQSDGTYFILSAWNMLDAPQNTSYYRRIGFREMGIGGGPYYYCNHPNIGGNNPTPYTITKDYYKYSYTYTNITFCSETPPSGA